MHKFIKVKYIVHINNLLKYINYFYCCTFIIVTAVVFSVFFLSLHMKETNTCLNGLTDVEGKFPSAASLRSAVS